MNLLRRFIMIATILISCVGCDQATKSIAKSYLSESQALSLLGGSVRMQIAKNYGAFLNLGDSMPQTLRASVLSIGVGVVLSSMLAFLFLTKSTNPIVVLAIALIVGGGLSNLIDRWHYGGYVVDFINVGVWRLRTGIFNVADMCIMLGVPLLLFGNWLWYQRAGIRELRTNTWRR
jgi:signal peptidase II